MKWNAEKKTTSYIEDVVFFIAGMAIIEYNGPLVKTTF
jgi:hypothetical protein